MRKFILAAAMAAAMPMTANAAGDAEAGKAVFNKCKACHQLDKNAVGPMLKGIVGRKAAIRPGYAYSAPLKASNIVWTEANLIKWSASPGRMVPGTKMFFAGITSKNQQADLAAYLKTLK